MFSIGHFDQRIWQVRLAGLLLHEPDFMKALPADAPAQVSVELRDEKRHWLANAPWRPVTPGRRDKFIKIVRFWTSRTITVSLW